MATYDEECEYKKGFERAMEGKSNPESVTEIVFESLGAMFGFVKEDHNMREEGFKAGITERRRRKYYGGETLITSVKDMFGFDDRNVDPDRGFEAERRKKEKQK